MTKIERALNQMTREQILELFRSSTSPYAVCKKLGYKSSNKWAWDKIEKIALNNGFGPSEYAKPVIKTCLQCGKVLHKWQQKFCSQSCSATYNNKLRYIKKKCKQGLTDQTKRCLNCGQPIARPRPRAKYCSIDCMRKYEHGLRIKAWLEGQNFTIRNGMVPHFIRRYLIELHGNKCEKCGWSMVNPTTGAVPLEIHHIDGNCFNNDIKNLQLLCPCCHALTENFKALNKNCQRT